MNGESKHAAPKQQTRIGILPIFLILLLVGVIVVIAMQFMAPTIGNVFCIHDDTCAGRFNGGIVGTCRLDWEGVPTGKLVLIIPKTMKKQNQIIGFAYSPSVYSRGNINEIKQQFIRELKLREYQVHIVKLDIFMDVNGYPRIPIYIDDCDPQDDRYFKGDNLMIDPDGLTVWHLVYESESFHQGSQNILIEFVHDDPGFIEYHQDSPDIISTCGYLCEKVVGSVPIELQNRLSIWDGIQAIWLFSPPFGSLFLLSLIVLIIYFGRKRIQKIRANHTLE